MPCHLGAAGSAFGKVAEVSTQGFDRTVQARSDTCLNGATGERGCQRPLVAPGNSMRGRSGWPLQGSRQNLHGHPLCLAGDGQARPGALTVSTRCRNKLCVRHLQQEMAGAYATLLSCPRFEYEDALTPRFEYSSRTSQTLAAI